MEIQVKKDIFEHGLYCAAAMKCGSCILRGKAAWSNALAREFALRCILTAGCPADAALLLASRDNLGGHFVMQASSAS